MRLSLQGPTAADGWESLFGIKKTAQSFLLLLTIKIAGTEIPMHCQWGEKKSISDGVFYTNAVTLTLDHTAATSVSLLFWNDSHKQHDKMLWERFALPAVSSLAESDLVFNLGNKGKQAKGSASLECTGELLQDQGDGNVKQPASAFTTLHMCAHSPMLKQGLPSHTSCQKKHSICTLKVLLQTLCVTISVPFESSQRFVLSTKCWNN